MTIPLSDTPLRPTPADEGIAFLIAQRERAVIDAAKALNAGGIQLRDGESGDCLTCYELREQNEHDTDCQINNLHLAVAALAATEKGREP